MNPIKITIERSADEKLELTIPADLPIDNTYDGDGSWEETIRTILVWVGFSAENINELFDANEFGEPLGKTTGKIA